MSHFSQIRKRPISRAKQSGFSIVELMVAGMLGLFLLGGVIQLFLGSNQNYIMQDDLATIQEDGRFAMMYLEDQIQIAGVNESDTGKEAVAAVDVFTVGASSDGANDSFTVSYIGVDPSDCNGVSLGIGNIEVSNQFYIDGDDNLMCQGSGGGTAQPLLTNVEKFQVLYGVETDKDCPDGVVNSYMNYDTYTAYQTANGIDENNVMILSIKIGLLLRSESSVLPVAEQETVQVLDQTFTPAEADKLTRRLFTQTVFMPNAAYSVLPYTGLDCAASEYD